jgi:hypothetical protein
MNLKELRTEVLDPATGALTASASYLGATAGITIEGVRTLRFNSSEAPRPQGATMNVVDADNRPMMTLSFDDGRPGRMRPFAVGHAVIRGPDVDRDLILATCLAFHVLSVKLSPSIG